MNNSMLTNFFLIYLFYLFIFDCVGSSFLREGSLQLRQAGATLHRSARASRHRGLSCCGAQAPDAQAQQLWLTGVVAPRHVGSSQTRAQTRAPCIGRQILNHCATREAPSLLFFRHCARGSVTFHSHDLGMLFNTPLLHLGQTPFPVPNCPTVHGSPASEPPMPSFLHRCVHSFAIVPCLKSKHRHSPQGHFLLVNLPKPPVHPVNT